jgi:hypothetical protein
MPFIVQFLSLKMEGIIMGLGYKRRIFSRGKESIMLLGVGSIKSMQRTVICQAYSMREIRIM